MNKLWIPILLVLNIYGFRSKVTNRMEHDIKKIIYNIDPDINIGLKVYSLRKKATVFAINEKHLFTPASNAKLFTAAAVIFLLGENYRFTTKMYIDKENNLCLQGSGDPTFKTRDLEKLVTSLKDKKINKIRDIILDDLEFDNVLFGAGWMWDDVKARFNSPISALNINHNCYKISNKNETTVISPALYAGEILKKLLQKHKISFSGNIIVSPVSKSAKLLATHNSEILSKIVKFMLKQSDNLYAECLFKKIGALKKDSGKNVLCEFLSKEVKLDTSKLVLVDGSGMSRYNLISCDQLVELMKWIYSNSNFSRMFFDCLPKSGVDGTLKTRLKRGYVCAKTGSMQGVSSLAGYLLTAKQEPLAFAILINGFADNPKNYKDLEDKICEYFSKL